MVHYDLFGGGFVEIQPKRSKKLLHTVMAVQIPWGAPQVEPIPVFLPRLPAAFCGARVAVVADVHLPDNAVRLPRLINCVALQRPDAIFLPGDLTNSYTDFDAAGLRRLAKALAAIAPSPATTSCVWGGSRYMGRFSRNVEYTICATAMRTGKRTTRCCACSGWGIAAPARWR